MRLGGSRRRRHILPGSYFGCVHPRWQGGRERLHFALLHLHPLRLLVRVLVPRNRNGLPMEGEAWPFCWALFWFPVVLQRRVSRQPGKGGERSSRGYSGGGQLTSSPKSAASPASAPPLSSESFTFFRTSFQERNVRSRETFALSWRMRNMRSATEIERTPRRLANAVA